MFESFFKSYFWVFQLGVICAAGLLVSRTVSGFVEQGLQVPAEAWIELAPPNERSDEGPRDPVELSAFLERNFMDALREDLIPDPEPKEGEPGSEGGAEKSAPGEVDLSSCSNSRKSLELLATMVSAEAANSVAVFKKSDETAMKVHEGEALEDGSFVQRIAWRSVYLNANGKCEFVSLDEQAQKAAKRTPVEVSKNDEDDVEFGKGVKKVKEDEYVIEKAEIDSVLSNLNKLATQARIVPSFQNGKANGFKLFSIRPNSLYAKIGIQNGDIIQKINGFELNSPDKALEIYGKLKDAQNVTVDLLRRGKSKSLGYTIR